MARGEVGTQIAEPVSSWQLASSGLPSRVRASVEPSTPVPGSENVRSISGVSSFVQESEAGATIARTGGSASIVTATEVLAGCPARSATCAWKVHPPSPSGAWGSQVASVDVEVQLKVEEEVPEGVIEKVEPSTPAVASE